jgi:hypothetical protein
MAGKKFGKDLIEIEVEGLSWKTIKSSSNDSPLERGNAAIEILYDRYIVLFGGDHSTMQCLNDLWLYDLQQERWYFVQEGIASPSKRAGSYFAKYIPKVY